MQKSVRLLKIWKLCKENRYMTASKLARICGVSERQIYRDINSLIELGVTISMNGGYRVVDETLLPQLDFTNSERIVLTMALKALPLHQDKELEEIANSLFNKLLESPEESNLAILETKSLVHIKGQSFIRLQKAIESHFYVILIRYTKLDNEILCEQRIEPYYLIHRARHWYLIAWTESQKAFRTYRLDRIEKLRLEDRKFNPREFDIDDYFRGSLGVLVDKPQHLRVRFSGLAKEIVKKGGRVAIQDLREEGNYLILDTTISGEILWLRWILGFGKEAEILEPLSMREKAKEMLQAGLKNYLKEK